MAPEHQPNTAPGTFDVAQPNAGVWLGGGLCDCCRDGETCCITYLLPCLTYARNRRRIYGNMGGSSAGDFCLYCVVQVFTGCHCCLGIGPRADLRRKYGLPETPCGDCCVHFWCHLCALCQEARELKARSITQLPGVGIVSAAAPPPMGQPAYGYPDPQQGPQYGAQYGTPAKV